MTGSTALPLRFWMAAGWTMLHFFWVGAGLALLAASGRVLLRSAHPNLRYAFSLMSLAALAATPGVIAVRVWDSPHPADFPSVAATVAVPPVRAEGDPSPSPEVEAGGAFPEVPSGPAMPPGDETRASARLAIAMEAVARYLPWLWLTGTPLTLALVATGLIGAERLRRQSLVIEEGPIPELCWKLAESLRVSRDVAVAACDRLASPVLLGIARPMILIPTEAVTGWSADQLEMVLLHELAHVRRWDNLVNLVQRVVEALLFFHPAVWIVSRWVRLEREHCCDRVVVDRTERPRAYAEALASLALPGLPPRQAVVAMADGHVASRIRRILNVEDYSAGLTREALALLGATLFTPLLVLACLAGEARPPVGGAAPEPDDPPEPRAKAEGTSVPPQAGPPRYRWKAGQVYPYAVRVEIRGLDEVETLEGLSTYAVRDADDDGFVLEHQGRLASRIQARDGRPSFRPFRMGPYSSPFSGVGTPGLANPTRFRIDPSGRILEASGTSRLPYALGDLAFLVIAALPAEGRSSWEATSSCATQQTDDDPPGVVLTHPDIPRPSSSSGGGFGAPGLPFGPPSLSPFASVLSRPEPARERLSYTLGTPSKGTVPIAKRYEMATEATEDGVPLIRLAGQGQMLFDLRAGVPLSYEFKGTFTDHSGGRRLRIPLTVSYKRVEGTPAPGQSRAKPEALTPGDLEGALADLTSGEASRARAAADLLARAEPDRARRPEVAGALASLLGDGDAFTRQSAAKALGAWGSPRDTAALLPLVDDPSFAVRWGAMEALGRLRAGSAATAIAERLKQDRAAASAALKAIGPAAERPVIAALSHEDWPVRLEACHILQEIGTRASLPALGKASRDDVGLVALAAKDALKAIARRP
jgi:beta-lactamase regulating signal transducer with metallopeptidase domain